MNSITENHLAVISGEHTGISPLTSKRVQPRKDKAVYHHLLNCNYSLTFENFSVVCSELRPSMNQNMCSPPLYLLE